MLISKAIWTSENRRLIAYLLLGALAVTLGAIVFVPRLLATVGLGVGEFISQLVSQYFSQFDVLLSPTIYIVVFCVLALERLIPAKRNQPIFSVGFAQDLGWFVLNFLPLTVFVFVWGGLLKFLYDQHLAFLTIHAFDAWPIALRIGLAVLFMDFVRWFHHLLRHKLEFLWYFHTIHHSQREMNFFTDYRVHFVDLLVASTISFIPLYMFGATADTSAYVVLILRWYTGIYHGNLRTDFGILRYILVTPQSHRIHHSNKPAHYNTNYGVTFSIWDHLFGTQHRNYDDYPDTGVPFPDFPVESRVSGVQILANYWRQIAYPFRQVYRQLGRQSEA